MKPTDFFLGIRDLFIFLVPGSLFLLLYDPQQLLVKDLSSRVGGLGLFGFATMAYAIGAIFAAAGSVLDKLVYEPLSKIWFRTEKGRRIVWLEFLAQRFEQLILERSSKFEDFAVRGWNARGFWWEQLRLHCPIAISEIDRAESIQKLFRTLVIVFIFNGTLSVFGEGGAASGGWSQLGLAPRSVAFNTICALICLFMYLKNRVLFASTVYRFAISYSITPEMIGAAREEFGRELPEYAGSKSARVEQQLKDSARGGSIASEEV